VNEPAVTVEVHLSPDDLRRALVEDATTGLSSSPKSMPPVWFYDDRGSALFDEITRLPEYYPTRCERAILDAHARDIAARAGADVLVELGSGTSEKTRLLLDALRDLGLLHRFVPLDVSEQTLRDAAASIAAEYEGVAVHAVVGDFNQHLGLLPAGGRRLVAFLGGTIGNLLPVQRRRFLFDLDCALTVDDRLLVGTDLVKDVATLEAAYNDSAGVTAAFNRNLLLVLNRELHADFDVDAFEHVATWDAAEEWVDIGLRATTAQRVTVADLGIEVRFDAGEVMRTEVSSKFRPDLLEKELWDGGFVVEETWTDPQGWFQLTLARPYC
jgi:L-histidine N-alpha-methyltransferase